ncbi:EscV/YscV/HrcV family type III secretion system export apparatus protein [Trinickia symbiotica]|uniref:EscV/YscV/HrcV family type III secretion system export apparatus protein n=2 Tax=Trinickia symbiotica TaxID=863227 RepID=A0A2N7X8D3_9BURK|nr:EscV/YscV/HrcV family type III secretion system export apparatus protein [Trinickia symbiotica]
MADSGHRRTMRAHVPAFEWAARVFEPASRWLARIGERSDAVVAVLVALVIFMMVLPLPTLVIDALIAVNVTAAVLLVALALYLPSAVAFSSFPVVLLFTTLFRLGIEISTSRSILLSADAGAIVETFGWFVAGDNVVVGAIVFLVVAVVQFLVITKGAERVAEVAARFSLDSMPGRQMAIDADVRAGFARPETAQQLRGELARESRMHGAMDGAMKFVKGDALAGFVIVFVNLTAGVAIGVAQNGLALSDALQRYAILTIGNALVAQIPALLISIAAAVLITRGGEDAARSRTVGREIVEQVGAAPAAWVIAGCIAALFAVVPGMPWPMFVALAAALLLAGAARLRRDAAARRRVATASHAGLGAASAGSAASLGRAEVPIPDEYDVREIIPIRQIVVSVSPATLRDERFAALVRAARRMRNEIVMRYGLTVPPLEIEGVARLDGDAYEIAVQEVVAAHGRLRWDCLCVSEKSLDESLRAHAQLQTYPLIEGAVWVERARLASRESVANESIGAIEYFSRLFAQLLQRHAAQFVGVHEAQLLFGWLQREMPAAAKELAQALSLPRFAEVLRLLVSERVSLRNVKQIVETLVSWAPREKESPILAEHVRQALSGQICQEFAEDGVLCAVLLERDLEDKLRASLRQTAQGAVLAVDHETLESLSMQARTFAAAAGRHRSAPVILTAQDLRRPLRQLVRDTWFDLHVLSYTELTATQRVRSIGMIKMDSNESATGGH